MFCFQLSRPQLFPAFEIFCENGGKFKKPEKIMVLKSLKEVSKYGKVSGNSAAAKFAAAATLSVLKFLHN